MEQWTWKTHKHTHTHRWKCCVEEHHSIWAHRGEVGHTHTYVEVIYSKGRLLSKGRITNRDRPETDILPTSCVNLNTENTAVEYRLTVDTLFTHTHTHTQIHWSGMSQWMKQAQTQLGSHKLQIPILLLYYLLWCLGMSVLWN